MNPEIKINAELLQFIKLEITKEVRRVLSEMPDYGLANKFECVENTEPRWVKVTQLCMELRISKQTFYNWVKNERKARVINMYVKYVGEDRLFDLTGLRNALRDYPELFDRWGQKKKLYVVLNREEKQRLNFLRIGELISIGERITQEEKKFYYHYRKGLPKLDGKMPYMK